jgi:hypothetical protein
LGGTETKKPLGRPRHRWKAVRNIYVCDYNGSELRSAKLSLANGAKTYTG